jgi:uncharacterized coiled-coil protein SlyX
MKIKRWFPTAAFGLALLLATAQAAELPVKHVVLFKHGIGYFQRQGRLEAGETAQLDFNSGDMNDVLKSLTLQESGQGTIKGLRYDSSLPLDRKLAEFPFRLGEGQPITTVLDQLKGAQIEMRFASETVRGAIVGARVVPRSEQRPEMQQVSLLLDSGEFRNVDLTAASGMKFVDAKLQAQFSEYLGALNQARSRDKRSVYIDSTGGAARDVTASYMIPMPIWKSSYRLIYPGGANAKPTLEGWAIIDNTTGEDWTNVQLSLVSGRPISFISRLYEPRYIGRQTADVEQSMAQAPVVYGGAVDEGRRADQPAGMATGQMALASPAAARAMAKMSADSLERNEMVAAEAPMPSAMPSAIAAAASAGELGELFEYRFGNTVTVRKNESAMLPFLQQEVTARKLVVFRDGGGQNPLHSMEITNSTGRTLDGGPITVYEGGGYAGEALVETLKKDDKRLISYGVDLGTRITTAFESKAEVVREVHIRRGVLATKSAIAETKTFTIKNVDAEPKTIIIEHPVRGGYDLVGMKESEKTANAYRFEVKVSGNATEKFPVNEERVYDRSVVVSSLTPDVLATYVSNKNLSANAVAQLQQILDLKRQIAATDNELRRMQDQINALVQDQSRLRDNINSLNRVAGQEAQVQNYSKQLAAQEVQIAGLRDKVSAAQQRKTTLGGQLDTLIEKMDF